MKYVKKFAIAVSKSETVCTPSTDYYSKPNDWQTETLDFVKVDGWCYYDTEEEAVAGAQMLEVTVESFIIIPIYIKK